ncbi:MAG TPA: hypothetical protein VGB17_15155 [Pyrinomonadaceae bacterium]|jgi:hypothetical protein
MATKPSIKIIKRRERIEQENGPEQAAATKETPREAAREMVATVTNWVSEFQQKRREETSRAIKTLFADQQPNEA